MVVRRGRRRAGAGQWRHHDRRDVATPRVAAAAGTVGRIGLVDAYFFLPRNQRAEALSALSYAGLERASVMPWPGEGIPALPPSDPALAADLADGTLASRLIVARAP